MEVQTMDHLKIEKDPKGRSPLELQRALQNLLAALRGHIEGVDLTPFPDKLTEAVRFNIEALHVELAELLDQLPWKSWKDYPPDFLDDQQLNEIRFEAIDCLHFLNNIFIALGMEDEDIKTFYWAKHKENVLRQWGKYSREHPNRELPEEYR